MPLLRRHSTIATAAFVSATLGSFYYTMSTGRSAWIDAETMMTGSQDAAAEERQRQFTYQLKFR